MLQLLAIRGGQHVGVYKHIANVAVEHAKAINSVVAQINSVGITPRHVWNQIC